MTRINSNINPLALTDEHLKAEIRELPRIFSLVLKHLNNGKTVEFLKSKADEVPEFKLNSGHVIYFYDKLDMLLSMNIIK